MSRQVEAETVHGNLDYWEQTDNSVVSLRDLRRKENASAEPFVFERVSHDSHRPDYEVSPSGEIRAPQTACGDELTPCVAVFWSLAAKNPVKSVRDYHEGFDHNMPVPVVSNGEVVYSFEGPALYFNVLNQIIAMERRVDADHPDFLRLVVDHVQIFERHWRKMVADIRQGRLDRSLQVSSESRQIFESTNLPRPLLAERLDLTFRQLGFHKKVLGKDIVIQPYAALRHPPSRAHSASTSGDGRVVRKASEPLLKRAPSFADPNFTDLNAGMLT